MKANRIGQFLWFQGLAFQALVDPWSSFMKMITFVQRFERSIIEVHEKWLKEREGGGAH